MLMVSVLLIVIGGLLCLTIIGIPLGVPLIVVGYKLWIKVYKGDFSQDGETAQQEESARRVFDIPGVQWVKVPGFELLPSGEISSPCLPAVPGIVRLELIDQDPKRLSVSFLESDDLTIVADEDDTQRQEHRAHLIAGGSYEVYYIDKLTLAAGDLDLTITANRTSIIASLEKRASDSGYWYQHASETYGKTVLLFQPAVQQ